MTGGQKAAAIIALAVIALAWFNWRMWRGLKAAQATRAAWTDADFCAMLVADGVAPAVAQAVRSVASRFYGEGISPHPDDDFARFLGVEPEEIEEMVAEVWPKLGLAEPTAADPQHIPQLRDLRELARYLDSIVTARRMA
jgi:hypothetical protein